MLCCNLVEGMLFQLVVSPSLMDRITVKQDEDEMLKHIKGNIMSKKGNTQNEWGTEIDGKGILRINNRICVPNVDGLRQEMLRENHQSSLSFHP